MKSKTSCFNKTIFKKNITLFWPIWLVITAWNIIMLPLMIYQHSQTYLEDTKISASEIIAMRMQDILTLVEAYMYPGVLFVFSVVAAMAVFHYLYHTRSAYTIHALPVTKKELFVTNYISGLLFLVVPETIGGLLGIMVGQLCGYNGSLYLLQGMLFAIGVSFFFYSFTVFIAMFTGQLYAVPVFVLIINFLYVGGRVLLFVITSILCYGASFEDFTVGMWDVLSPVYYITHTVGVRYDTGQYGELIGGEIVLGYSIAAIIFIVAAYYVYKMRHTETAGNLISIPLVAPVFRWGAAIYGGLLFGILFCGIMGVSSVKGAFVVILIAALLFAGVFFFGAQMFLEKGFRVFKKKRVIECVGLLGVLTVLFVAIECDWFGQEKKVPDVSQIERAYVLCHEAIGGDDADTIAQITELHHQIVDSKAEFEELNEKEKYKNSGVYLEIKYFLKGGKVLHKQYQIPMQKEMAENPETVMGKLVEVITDKESYLKNVVGANYQDIKIKEGYMDLYQTGNETVHDLNKEESEKLYQAFLKDIEEGNYESMILANLIEDKEYGKNTYCDNLNFEYSSQVKIHDMYDEFNSSGKENLTGNHWSQSKRSGCYVQFDKNCTNIIEALVEIGVIENEEDLTTLEEMDSMAEG